MKYYNKINYLNWIEIDDNKPQPDNFVAERPLGWEYYPYLPKQSLNEETGEWELIDDCLERTILDKTTHLYSLDIRRAMRQLPSSTGEDGKTAEDDLDAMFFEYDQLEKEWLTAPNNLINLNDESTQTAMNYIQIDVDLIKRMILNVGDINNG